MGVPVWVGLGQGNVVQRYTCMHLGVGVLCWCMHIVSCNVLQLHPVLIAISPDNHALPLLLLCLVPGHGMSRRAGGASPGLRVCPVTQAPSCHAPLCWTGTVSMWRAARAAARRWHGHNGYRWAIRQGRRADVDCEGYSKLLVGMSILWRCHATKAVTMSSHAPLSLLSCTCSSLSCCHPPTHSAHHSCVACRHAKQAILCKTLLVPYDTSTTRSTTPVWLTGPACCCLLVDDLQAVCLGAAVVAAAVAAAQATWQLQASSAAAAAAASAATGGVAAGAAGASAVLWPAAVAAAVAALLLLAYAGLQRLVARFTFVDYVHANVE